MSTTFDLFLDEDVDDASRLRDTRVDCEMIAVPSAFHVFDAVFRNAGVTRDFHRQQQRALGAALGCP
jgi:acetyl esterase/lipase